MCRFSETSRFPLASNFLMQPRRLKESSAHVVLFLVFLVLGSAWGRAALPTPYESNLALAPATRIDELVFSKLRKSNIQPANVCSDAVFVRRVYLDVIGTLPQRWRRRVSFLTGTRTSDRPSSTACWRGTSLRIIGR